MTGLQTRENLDGILCDGRIGSGEPRSVLDVVGSSRLPPKRTLLPSFRRKPETRFCQLFWTPAFAGETRSGGAILHNSTGLRGIPDTHSGEIHCYTSRRFEPIRVPRKHEESDSQDEELYEVRIIDNDHNTYGEVMQITMLALGISEDKAFGVAWDVDHYGSCVVAHAAREEAEELAGIIRLIGIEVQVNPLSGRIR